jgi:pyrroloquinoline quinone biosynthesis protein D
MQPPSSDAFPRISPRARLQNDKITGKPVLLYPEGVLMLNPTGHAIVLLCAGKLNFQEMVANLAERYKVPAQQVEKDAAQFLSRLRDLNLLELLPASVEQKQ